jgi:hypothetical protein
VPPATTAAALAWLCGAVSEPGFSPPFAAATAAGTVHAVVWLDTESGPRRELSLLQLCVAGGAAVGRVLVVHARSGALAAVGAFLAAGGRGGGRGGPLVLPLCVGAELAGDAVDLLAAAGVRLAACLDATPLYSASGGGGATLGLRSLVNKIFGTGWEKSAGVTTSHWERPPLSAAQLQYAAVDAWASEALGRAALAGVEL